jgi:aspartate racemase
VKRIGLLGGMSWESSIEYERLINEEVRRRLGGTHSADLVIRSYDFAEIEALQGAGDWDEAGRRLAADARGLETMGAALVVLCTNTMHRVADQIQQAISVTLLHIADPTGEAIRARGLQRVGLLGTRYTMEAGFYRGRLEDTHGLEVLVPLEAERATVHRIIFDELVKGVVDDGSRLELLSIIRGLVDRGAEGVIAGCTEIELLVTGEQAGCPYFPTTRLHALAAVDLALG